MDKNRFFQNDLKKELNPEMFIFTEKWAKITIFKSDLKKRVFSRKFDIFGHIDKMKFF